MVYLGRMTAWSPKPPGASLEVKRNRPFFLVHLPPLLLSLPAPSPSLHHGRMALLSPVHNTQTKALRALSPAVIPFHQR